VCKSRSEGGQRCASHARALVDTRAAALDTARESGDARAVVEATDAWLDAAAVYASTDEGYAAVTGGAALAAHRGDQDKAAALLAAAVRGDRIRARNRTVAGRPPEDRLAVGRYRMTVHPKQDWPFAAADPAVRQTVTLQPWTEVHTTQAHVWADHVTAKRGTGAQVDVLVDTGPDGRQRVWVLDGHHALAAARSNAEPVTALVHRTGRGDPVDPPRLHAR
jgi:hypothetical protein